MRHVPVASGHVRSYGYEGGVLEVEFANGSRYRYHDVPAAEVGELCAARSFGTALRGRVVGRYREERVRGSDRQRAQDGALGVARAIVARRGATQA